MRLRPERGQALVLVLGAMAGIVAGALLLGALGKALGAKSHAQRAADLAAVSAARVAMYGLAAISAGILPRPAPAFSDGRLTTTLYLPGASPLSVYRPVRLHVVEGSVSCCQTPSALRST